MIRWLLKSLSILKFLTALYVYRVMFIRKSPHSGDILGVYRMSLVLQKSNWFKRSKVINEKSPHSGDMLGAYHRVWISKKHISCGLRPPLIYFFGDRDACDILLVYHQSVVIFLIYRCSHHAYGLNKRGLLQLGPRVVTLSMLMEVSLRYSLYSTWMPSTAFKEETFHPEILQKSNHILRKCKNKYIGKNPGWLWLAYTELQGDFYMLQLTHQVRIWACSGTTSHWKGSWAFID